MERLIELAKIITKERTKRVNIIGQEKNGTNSLTKQLYEGIISGKISNDTEAGKILYGENFDQNTYIRTKYRLEEKLLNSLFFINLNNPNATDLQKNYYKCNKDAAAVKFLLGKTARIAGISLAEKTFRLALKYEFTEIALDLGRILKRHYRLINPNKEKAQYFIQKVNYYKKVLELEILAEEFREEIGSQYSPSRATQSELKDKVIQYEKILKEELADYSSYKLYLNYYLIAILRYRVVNEHKEVIRICQEGVNYFETVSGNKSTNPIVQFCIEIIFSCISLKEYNLGEKTFRKVANLPPIGSINWFLILESYIILCFHTGKYNEAYEILLQATTHKKYRQLPIQYQEIWKVYDAYCHFLIETNHLDISNLEVSPFKLAKFLNNVPQYSKDKLGVNISILIIQILFLLNRKKSDKIITRMEALTQYSYRYLIKDETLRSNCFIKMLAKMVKAGFHKNATIRTTKKLFERLAETPIATKGHSQYVEIIPYEILWDMALNKLVNRAM